MKLQKFFCIFVLVYSLIIDVKIRAGNVGNSVDCGNVLTNVRPCLKTLESRINTTLQSYDRTFVQPSNTLGSDYIYLAVRDEMCRSSNQATINCFLSNLTACSGVTVQTEQFVYADYLPQTFTQTSTTDLLCSYYQTKGCEARERIFVECFRNLLPEFITSASFQVTIDRACQSQNIAAMNCMLESSKDCRDVVFQDLQYYNTLKDHIVVNKWNLFENAQGVCSCAIKSSCQQTLDNLLKRYVFRSLSSSVYDEYTTAIGYGEEICRINDSAVCSYTGFAAPCTRTLYANLVENFKQYHDFAVAVCPDLLSQEYTDNRDCILEELTKNLATCKNILPSSERNLECPDLVYLYRCFHVILDGKCGNLAPTMYEVFREYYRLAKCTLPSIVSSAFRPKFSVIETVLSFLLIVTLTFNFR